MLWINCDHSNTEALFWILCIDMLKWTGPLQIKTAAYHQTRQEMKYWMILITVINKMGHVR